ncbi:uncharacterized protein [Diadema antillarum]|uniref:uncharacterized protein n=1 Tax=Diadema antillarum TaxID=105358 RepID=UPI003A8A4809
MGYLRIIAIFTACFILMSTEIDCQIPDDVVVVDVRPVLLRGLPGKLKCQFSVVPQAVYWLKEHTANSVTLLVKWFRNEIDGKGFSDGLMTIDANFSLIIHTVNDDDAGRYFCRVADFRNNVVQNHTDVSVADFLSVEGCSTADCFLVSNQQDATLRCNARNVPQEVVRVYWLPNDGKISLIAYHSLFNENGTENIEAVVKITPDVNDVFTCVAEIKSTRAELARVSVTAVPQTPTNTMTNLAPMVTATSQPNDQKGANIVPIAASVIGVIALAVVFCVVYKFFKCE